MRGGTGGDLWVKVGWCYFLLLQRNPDDVAPHRTHAAAASRGCFSLICGLYCFVRRPAAAVGTRVKSTAMRACVRVGETAVCARSVTPPDEQQQRLTDAISLLHFV